MKLFTVLFAVLTLLATAVFAGGELLMIVCHRSNLARFPLYPGLFKGSRHSFTVCCYVCTAISSNLSRIVDTVEKKLADMGVKITYKYNTIIR